MDILSQNGLYDDSRVVESERIRVKNLVRSHLKSAEEKLLVDLSKRISESVTLTNTRELSQHVTNWIVHGQCTALVDYLSLAIYEQKIAKLSKFGNNLKRLGVNLAADDESQSVERDSGCKWVPAAFSKVDGKRVYGGVFLRPMLSSQNGRGFQGFQATTKNAGSARGGSSGTSAGHSSGASGSSAGGASGPPNGGSPPPSPPPKTRKAILEKYGHGKGWPKTPIRLELNKKTYTYFGKPDTCKSFYRF